ncbi:ribonuclease P protein component 1 [Haloferacaceae archaeon DSL9]
MALTPDTLTRHELIGLPVRVADAPNADLVGICGRVVSETMRTISVACESGAKQVPKRGTTFEFALAPSNSATDCIGAVTDATSVHTDEAAGYFGRESAEGSSHRRRRKDSGSASERGSDTAGTFPRQSGSSASRDAGSLVGRGDCEGVVYVTVDGTRLLSRPAERTERAGDSKWR